MAPFSIARGQSSKLKIAVLLPKSGVQGLIGQSCQKGADLAPAVIRELLGVEIELMNADTETNVDTARTRAERLIQEGAHCLVGPFDSGAAGAIAQVAQQRGVPFVINIAAAPQITEQGYKYVFRNFPIASELVKNGLALSDELFRATGSTPRTAVFMHVNDTFGQANAKAIGAILPQLNLPFKLVLTKAVDAAFKKQNPQDQLRFHALNVGYTFEAILIVADAYKRAKSTDAQALTQAIRQTEIKNRMMFGGPIKFNAKGQVEGNLSACIQNQGQKPVVVLPAAAAEAKPVFPWRDYKKT